MTVCMNGCLNVCCKAFQVASRQEKHCASPFSCGHSTLHQKGKSIHPKISELFLYALCAFALQILNTFLAYNVNPEHTGCGSNVQRQYWTLEKCIGK